MTDLVFIREELRRISQSVYLQGLQLSLPIGLRTSYLRVPPEFQEQFPSDLEKLNASDYLRGLLTGPLPSHFARQTIFETIGFWDWATLRYLDDLYKMTAAETPPLPKVSGHKTLYGIVLATNCGVLNGEIVDVPFCNGTQSREPGLFAHYKLNPYLHFTGRTDLLVHVTQFLVLLTMASNDLWSSSVTELAIRRVVSRLKQPRVLENRLVGRVQALVRRWRTDLGSGIKFLIVQGLDWTDLSVYLAGRKQSELARLAFLIRELPVVFPRLVSSLKVLADDPTNSEELLFGGTRDGKSARRDELVTERIVEKARLLYRGKRHWPALPPRAFIPEMPVFCDYVDVYTTSPDNSSDLVLVQSLQVKTSRARELAEELGSSSVPELNRLHLVSGPVDLVRLPEGASSSDTEPDPELLTAQITSALTGLRPNELYERTITRPSMFRSLGPLMERFYSDDNWVKIDAMLRRLGVPRVLIRSLGDLMLQHLSYRKQPKMVDTLFEYHGLWQNLSFSLFDMIVEEERQRAINYRVEESPARRFLIQVLPVFVEKVSQALNARYHNTSSVFEVADFNHNHKGGVDTFLGAYSELVYTVFEACAFVDTREHLGFVKVGESSNPRIYSMFCSLVEVDWLKLAKPENSLVILHELGHELLRDPLLAPLRHTLGDEDVWADILETSNRSLEQSTWCTHKNVANLFEDVFCDFFVSFLIYASTAKQERGKLLDRFALLYDQFFLSQLEMRAGGAEAVSATSLQLALVRWFLVREVLKNGKETFEPQEAPWQKLLQALRGDLGAAARERDSRAERLQGLYHREKEEFLEFEKQDLWAVPSEDGRGPEEEPYSEAVGLGIQKYLDGREFVTFPSPEEWLTLLRSTAVPLSWSVTRAVLRSEDSEKCKFCKFSCLDGFCEVFTADSYCMLFSVLRSVESFGNAAQLFIGTCLFYLQAIVRLDQPESLRAVSNVRQLGEKLMGWVFEKEDSRLAYMQFNWEGKMMGLRSDVRAVVNPKGGVFLRDPESRAEVFGERTGILCDLAEGRLTRLSRILAEVSVDMTPAGGDERNA